MLKDYCKRAIWRRWITDQHSKTITSEEGLIQLQGTLRLEHSWTECQLEQDRQWRKTETTEVPTSGTEVPTSGTGIIKFSPLSRWGRQDRTANDGSRERLCFVTHKTSSRDYNRQGGLTVQSVCIMICCSGSVKCHLLNGVFYTCLQAADSGDVQWCVLKQDTWLEAGGCDGAWASSPVTTCVTSHRLRVSRHQMSPSESQSDSSKQFNDGTVEHVTMVTHRTSIVGHYWQVAVLSRPFCTGLVQLGPAVVTIVERWLFWTVTTMDRFHCTTQWSCVAPQGKVNNAKTNSVDD